MQATRHITKDYGTPYPGTRNLSTSFSKHQKAQRIFNMPAGRPTTFNEEVAKAAREYLSDDESVNYKSHDHAIPSIVGMCRVIKRPKSTVYDWAKTEGHEFSDILAESNEFQELVTINGTLKGELNAQIGKLVLGKHGYHEKQEVNATVTEISHEEWLKSLE